MFLTNNYRFSPSLLPSLAALVVFIVLVSLGFWQLDRAEEKRAIERSVHQAQAQPALNLNEAVPDRLLTSIYRRSRAEGYYDSRHQFLYDNRTHKGKPGYHVLTPLRLKNKEQQIAVMVNRGWIPYQGSRDNIPNIDVIEEVQVIEGEIRNPSQAIVLNEITQNMMSFPMTIQSISLPSLSKQLGYPLLPVVIELDATQPFGFVREWQPYYGKIDKHIAYAIQWFLMSAILLFLYIKLNTKRVIRKVSET